MACSERAERAAAFSGEQVDPTYEGRAAATRGEAGMGTRISRAGAVVLALAAAAFAVPAAAKTDPKAAAKPAGHLRWAHSYAAALAEAKDRGCVLFATFHEDG